MQSKGFAELYEEFRGVAQGGNEQKVKDFLITHFNDFPREVQNKIILAFFIEGIETAATDAQLLNDFQVKTLGDMKKIEQIKQELKDKLRLVEIQKKISD